MMEAYQQGGVIAVLLLMLGAAVSYIKKLHAESREDNERTRTMMEETVAANTAAMAKASASNEQNSRVVEGNTRALNGLSRNMARLQGSLGGGGQNRSKRSGD